MSALPCCEHERDFASGCLVCVNYELDQLRARVEWWRNEFGGVAQETLRLRAVIESAPHAHLECTARGLDCTCWKADAL